MRGIRGFVLALGFGLLAWLWLNSRRQIVRSAAEVRVAPSLVRTAMRTHDFTLIAGIGPAYARALNHAGIFTFEQLGRQDAEELAGILKKTRVTAARIRRDRWIEQARERWTGG